MDQSRARLTEQGLVRGVFRRRPRGAGPDRDEQLLHDHAVAWRAWLDRQTAG